jgi:hypothetical protein
MRYLALLRRLRISVDSVVWTVKAWRKKKMKTALNIIKAAAAKAIGGQTYQAAASANVSAAKMKGTWRACAARRRIWQRRRQHQRQ